ncbi:MAG: DNA-3-methyladenine glycosylase I [Planctomycetota bacterium]
MPKTDRGSRCPWTGDDAQYIDYHDNEWGRPVADDRRLFEKLCLEGFQSGLSWLTILRKRENFRAACAGFDFAKLARFGERDVERLLGDADIVRHRGKIEAVIHNAGRVQDLIEERGSFAAHVWSFEPPASERPKHFTWDTLKEIAQTPSSKALSKDLRQRGWKFVGPTTAYAFMQSMGIVNDHIAGCPQREEVERAREQFVRPG